MHGSHRLSMVTRKAVNVHAGTLRARRLAGRVRLWVLSNGDEVVADRVHRREPPIAGRGGSSPPLVSAAAGVLRRPEDVTRLVLAAQPLHGNSRRSSGSEQPDLASLRGSTNCRHAVHSRSPRSRRPWILRWWMLGGLGAWSTTVGLVVKSHCSLGGSPP